jgi:hypothetical protein
MGQAFTCYIPIAVLKIIFVCSCNTTVGFGGFLQLIIWRCLVIKGLTTQIVTWTTILRLLLLTVWQIDKREMWLGVGADYSVATSWEEERIFPHNVRVFLSPSRQILGYYPKLSYDCFLPSTFKWSTGNVKTNLQTQVACTVHSIVVSILAWRWRLDTHTYRPVIKYC